VADCDACDRMATGTVVGSCTEEGHGTALSYIEDSCSAPPPSPPAGQPAGPPPPPACSELQQAVMDQCTTDCAECRVDTVQTVLGDCVLIGGALARDNMCAHIDVTPPTPQGVCTPLQSAVITHCASSCDTCDPGSIETVLAGCTVDGVAQAKGSTFCQLQCSDSQIGRVESCQQDCNMCGERHADFLQRVGACVYDDGNGGPMQAASSVIDEVVAGCGIPTLSCGQTVRGSTRGATNELGVTDCHEVTQECGQPSGEQKYLVTSESDIGVQFDSCASTYDTYLHLVTVDPWMKSMNSCDDCGGCGTRTVLDAELSAGHQYYLYIEGYDTLEGDYVVTMNCPQTAIGFQDGAIGCGETVRGNTVGEGSHVGNGASDHIYSFTAPAGGNGVVFDSCASAFDTHLRVYDLELETDPSCQSEAACPQFERVQCDDCGDCGTHTVLTTSTDPGDAQFYLPPGEYLLVVEGFADDEGEYVVEMRCL